ncbi:hypothetical protein sscle_05g042220 [Sclerotinia sclerotiorum 1980 UF-70]|nr:hypothetical protein sscle_05g042220 [Sclerotinia sclerotiorum 1980 UF-70]
MSDPPSYDQDLLNRLNALKKTNIQLDASTRTPLNVLAKESTPETDLSQRLRSLRNGTPSKSCTPKAPVPVSTTSPPRQSSFYNETVALDATPPFSNDAHDDKSLDELLAEIGSGSEWLDPDDPNDIQKLLDEAKKALPSGDDVAAEETASSKEASEENTRKGNILITGLDMSVFALDDEGHEAPRSHQIEGLETESREVQDIVARLLDEVNFERGDEDEAQEKQDRGERAYDLEKDKDEDRKLSSFPTYQRNDDEEPTFTLPSAPSTLPEPSRKSLDFEEDITARLAALKGLSSSTTSDPLNLPSAPTTKPVEKLAKSSKGASESKGNLKEYTDEEMDTWCIICQDDATVQCGGCEGDLYCARCWKEGHMGVDAGWEFKRHQWRKWERVG